MILQKIVDQTLKRVAQQKLILDYAQLKAEMEAARAPQNFYHQLAKPGVNIIAEIKRASPSQGNMDLNSDPVAIAGDYLSHGASALSVLTEPDFFRGDLGYLKAIRMQYPQAFLLMKDFVVDDYQLLQARVMGADAVLLIVRLLSPQRLAAMLELAESIGLSVLVEVHNQKELGTACRQGAQLIGVNNRDLDTLEIDLSVSHHLAQLNSNGATLISESGIETGEQIKKLRELGYQGFLIGTRFMKEGSPGKQLSQLLKESA